ncbi:hypothetical protein SUGI_0766700 [Cryptomeria japonica]|nr:hypothetical protein SUGI_0766700 [Cryptomeria japonica]
MAGEDVRESGGMESREGFTMDGSVDLKGRPVVRSKTGGWGACSFLVGYEIFERMAFYGIASNLVNYLTSELHEGTLASTRNVNNWSGAIWITPVIGAYIADTLLGRYWTFTIFSFIYILGMVILTLAVSLPSLKPPKCAKDVSGTKPNISTIGADQFDEFEPKERAQKVSFFNWWMFSVCFGALFANTFLIYIQEDVNFTVGYGVHTLGLIISVGIFLVGTPFYRHELQKGNPFGRIAQVIVAAVCKWRLKVPADAQELYELEPNAYLVKGRFPISNTPILRFLDKAAIKNDSISNPWRLCTVTQVEETKLMIKLLPIWVAMFIPSTILAQVNTLFIKQGNTLKRNMGPHFEIPSGCLSAFVTISMLVSIVIYGRGLVKLFRKLTGKPRGITMLQRIGIGLLIDTILMVVAAITEQQRIRVVKTHGLEGNPKAVAPLTVFILLPQFILRGLRDAFLEVGKLEFFYDRSPESMQSIGTALFATTFGIGNFISASLLTTVVDITVSWLYVYKRETSEAFGGSHGMNAIHQEKQQQSCTDAGNVNVTSSSFPNDSCYV